MDAINESYSSDFIGLTSSSDLFAGDSSCLKFRISIWSRPTGGAQQAALKVRLISILSQESAMVWGPFGDWPKTACSALMRMADCRSNGAHQRARFDLQISYTLLEFRPNDEPLCSNLHWTNSLLQLQKLPQHNSPAGENFSLKSALTFRTTWYKLSESLTFAFKSLTASIVYTIWRECLPSGRHWKSSKEGIWRWFVTTLGCNATRCFVQSNKSHKVEMIQDKNKRSQVTQGVLHISGWSMIVERSSFPKF